MKSYAGKVFLLLAGLAAAWTHSEAWAADKPVVVAATTMIESMLDYLAPEAIEVQEMIPASACPGTYDLRPTDAARLARAELFVRHDYLAWLDGRLRAQNRALEVAVIRTPGDLLVPDNYLAALAQLRDILSTRFPGQASSFAAHYSAAEKEVRQAGEEARAQIDAAGLDKLKILCSEKQAGFIRWTGATVAGTFGDSPDELSALSLGRIISAGRANGAELVAGNLQSGGQAVAGGVAAEMKLPCCVLSNFPGSNANNLTWPRLLLDNLALLARTSGVGTAHP